ncbi:MAG: T9SS type A sorting domain-containing protein [Ignavibacteriales bacterium]|nr:T9SS type A sorting domain-containing protein [Ignavibacteriales bacterium]
MLSSGYENWSPVWKFTTTDYPDILLAPENNSINIPTTVKLLWKRATNAISYLVQVSLDSTFTDSSFSYNVEDTLKVLENLKSYRKYFWKVQPTLSDGNEGWSEIWSFTTLPLPITFKLYQNHPNPFNPNTTISYQLPIACNVRLKIYDILGNEVATLVNEEKPSGSYNVEFTTNNLSSGIYFYRLQAGNFIETKKMILLK